MNAEHSDAILRLAEMVTDGVAVEWETEKIKTPHLSGELDGLKTVESVRIANAALTETANAERRPLFTWGKLEILELIGEGSFGQVYRAYDPDLQTELALKLRKRDEIVADERAIQDFLNEARRLARVRHPNVVIVHGAEVRDGRVGIWTEYIRGQTLEEYIVHHGPLGAREAAGIGMDLCRALAAVHAADLVHRDVKTSNVMREVGGRIVLMDFGSGGKLPPPGAVSKSQNVRGTPITMAPEQLEGKVAGPSTDIYALGVLLYRLVTREFPIEGRSIPELAEKHRRKETMPLRSRRPDLPSQFVSIVHRALSAQPADRYGSAGEMELALAAAHGASSVPRRWGRAIGWTALASSLAAAAIVFVPGLLHQRDQTTGRNPPAIPANLTATAALYRRSGGVDERLLPGGRISPGDKLSMQIQGSDSMYVYILNQDATGKVYVLFPLPGVQPTNPLPPSTRHRLPGQRGESSAYWDVTSAGGQEWILTIASRRPLQGLEEEIKGFPRAVAGRPIVPRRVRPQAVQQLRGIGGLSTDSPEEDQRPLSESLAKIAVAGSDSGNIWVWETRLENPAPAAAAISP